MFGQVLDVTPVSNGVGHPDYDSFWVTSALIFLKRIRSGEDIFASLDQKMTLNITKCYTPSHLWVVLDQNIC